MTGLVGAAGGVGGFLLPFALRRPRVEHRRLRGRLRGPRLHGGGDLGGGLVPGPGVAGVAARAGDGGGRVTRPRHRRRHGRPPRARGRRRAGPHPLAPVRAGGRGAPRPPTTGSTCRRCSTGPRPRTSHLAEVDWYDAHGIELVLGDPVLGLDTGARTAHTESGRAMAWDLCVLATGSSAFVPPIPGADAPGAFAYRTIDDLDAIRDVGRPLPARRRGRRRAPRPRSRQRPAPPRPRGHRGRSSRRASWPCSSTRAAAPRSGARSRQLGHRRAHRRRRHRGASPVPAGRCEPSASPRGTTLEADIVVFAAGIRPRDQLARAAGLDVGERGGVVVDDAAARRADGVYAVGEVACHGGRTYGLVAPGHAMAEVVVDRHRRRRRHLHRRRPLHPAQAARGRGGVGRRPPRRRPRGGGGRRGRSPSPAAGSGSCSTATAGCSAPCSSATPRPSAPWSAPCGPAGPSTIPWPCWPGRPQVRGAGGPVDEASWCARATTSPPAPSPRPSTGGAEDVAAVKSCTKAGTGLRELRARSSRSWSTPRWRRPARRWSSGSAPTSP